MEQSYLEKNILGHIYLDEKTLEHSYLEPKHTMAQLFRAKIE